MTTGKDFPVKFTFNHKALIFVSALVLASCGSPKHEGGPSGEDTQGKALPLSFVSVQSEILEASCVKCHEHYSSYENILSELPRMADSIAQGRMPKGGALSAANKKLFADWVAAGAPEKAGEEPIGDIPEPEILPNWKSLQATLFRPHCVACHSPQGQVPWLDFSTYEAILKNKGELFNESDAAASYMLEVILDPYEPMPPLESEVPPVNGSHIRNLILWVENGFPEE